MERLEMDEKKCPITFAAKQRKPVRFVLTGWRGCPVQSAR
jgi:hypothetical protein